MSKKSWFKGLKKAALPEAAPRSLEEIQKSYSDAVFQAGQAQYQAYVYKKEVERLNRVLESLNKEGANRQALDKATPSKQEPVQVVETTGDKNEQV